MIYDSIKSLLDAHLVDYFNTNYSLLPSDFKYAIHNEFEYQYEHDCEIVVRVLEADIQAGIKQIPIEIYFETLEEFKDNMLTALTGFAEDYNEEVVSDLRLIIRTPSVTSVFNNGGIKNRCQLHLSMTAFELSNVFNLQKLLFKFTPKINNQDVEVKEELLFIRYDLTYAIETANSGGMVGTLPQQKGINKVVARSTTNTYAFVCIVGNGKTYKVSDNSVLYNTNKYLKEMLLDKVAGENANNEYTLMLDFGNSNTKSIPCIVSVLGYSGTQRDIPILNISFMRTIS